MRFLTLVWMLTVIVPATYNPPSAEAAYGGITAFANRKDGEPQVGRHAPRFGLRCRANTDTCESSCYTVMKTMTRIVYDRVSEQREMVVYDTVWEKQVVQDIKRVSEVQSRVEQFTYQRPVYETVTQQVPYTVYRPHVETRTSEVAYTSYARSYETRVQSVPYTVHHTVAETQMQTVYYRVPRQVCGTKTIQERSGHWETRIVEYPRHNFRHRRGEQKSASEQKEDVSQKDVSQKNVSQKGTDPIQICRRVWVPRIETREVPYTKTVYEVQAIEVLRTVKRVVPEVRTRDLPYTVCRMVPVTQTRTVSYQVMRPVPEHRMRTVTGVIQQQVTEIGTRTVPYTNIREVPVTRTVTVPRQVPRTVMTAVVRTVPRQETYQVPVKICVPTGTGDPGKKKGGSKDLDWGGQVPAPVFDTQPVREQPRPADTRLDRAA